MSYFLPWQVGNAAQPQMGIEQIPFPQIQWIATSQLDPREKLENLATSFSKSKNCFTSDKTLDHLGPLFFLLNETNFIQLFLKIVFPCFPFSSIAPQRKTTQSPRWNTLADLGDLGEDSPRKSGGLELGRKWPRLRRKMVQEGSTKHGENPKNFGCYQRNIIGRIQALDFESV